MQAGYSPDDAHDKDSLVETADQALFLAKGRPFRSPRDQFVAALDETAMGLLQVTLGLSMAVSAHRMARTVTAAAP